MGSATRRPPPRCRRRRWPLSARLAARPRPRLGGHVPRLAALLAAVTGPRGERRGLGEPQHRRAAAAPLRCRRHRRTATNGRAEPRDQPRAARHAGRGPVRRCSGRGRGPSRHQRRPAENVDPRRSARGAPERCSRAAAPPQHPPRRRRINDLADRAGSSCPLSRACPRLLVAAVTAPPTAATDRSASRPAGRTRRGSHV